MESLHSLQTDIANLELEKQKLLKCRDDAKCTQRKIRSIVCDVPSHIKTTTGDCITNESKSFFFKNHYEERDCLHAEATFHHQIVFGLQSKIKLNATDTTSKSCIFPSKDAYAKFIPIINEAPNLDEDFEDLVPNELLYPYQKTMVRNVVDAVLKRKAKSEDIDNTKKIGLYSSTTALFQMPIGMGKTRVGLAVTYQLLNKTLSKHALFVCLPYTLESVLEEFQCLSESLKKPLNGFCLKSSMENEEQDIVINDWNNRGGLCLVGKELLMTTNINARIENAVRGKNLVMLFDECHTLLKPSNAVRKYVNTFLAKHRVIFIGMTGTLIPEGIDSCFEVIEFVSFNGNVTRSKIGWNKEFSGTLIFNLDENRLERISAKLQEIKQELHKAAQIYDCNDEFASCPTTVTLSLVYTELSQSNKLNLDTFIRCLSSPKFRHLPMLRKVFGLLSYMEKLLMPYPVSCMEVHDCRDRLPNFEDKIPFKDAEDWHSGKLGILSELFQHYQKAQRKVIFFSKFLSVLKYFFKIMKKKFNKRQLYLFTGDQSNTDNDRSISSFKSQKGFAVLFMSTALGVGINLQEASVVVLHEPSWNHVDIDQAVGRVARKGQKCNVEVFQLIHQGTLEEKLVEYSIKKHQIEKFFLNPRQENSITQLNFQVDGDICNHVYDDLLEKNGVFGSNGPSGFVDRGNSNLDEQPFLAILKYSTRLLVKQYKPKL